MNTLTHIPNNNVRSIYAVRIVYITFFLCIVHPYVLFVCVILSLLCQPLSIYLPLVCVLWDCEEKSGSVSNSDSFSLPRANMYHYRVYPRASKSTNQLFDTRYAHRDTRSNLLAVCKKHLLVHIHSQSHITNTNQSHCHTYAPT